MLGITGKFTMLNHHLIIMVKIITLPYGNTVGSLLQLVLPLHSQCLFSGLKVVLVAQLVLADQMRCRC